MEQNETLDISSLPLVRSHHRLTKCKQVCMSRKYKPQYSQIKLLIFKNPWIIFTTFIYMLSDSDTFWAQSSKLLQYLWCLKVLNVKDLLGVINFYLAVCFLWLGNGWGSALKLLLHVPCCTRVLFGCHQILVQSKNLWSPAFLVTQEGTFNRVCLILGIIIPFPHSGSVQGQVGQEIG